MHQNERLNNASRSICNNEFENLVEDACARLQAELNMRAPFLGKKVSIWMSRLSPTGKASEYFLQAHAFPFLGLPWWAANSLAAHLEQEFIGDVLYSTVNGYYYIRLIDNLMDDHGTFELKILPATAFFHTEFQAVYHKYFAAGHPFWEVFRSAWFSANDAVTRELDLDRIEREEFELVTLAKLAGVIIPVTAVGFRYDAVEHLRDWERFTRQLARWSQMEDDLFDWYDDLCHGKTSYFLSEAKSRKGSETVAGWVIREGFQRGLETLRSELHLLRRLVAPLNCPDVVRYLDLRETILESQKTRIGQAFQILKDVEKLTERPTTRSPD